MRVLHSAKALQDALAGSRNTAFVPTMGNLHAGHISLINLAQQQGGPVVASIFVNPLQFGVGEDFGRYPRTLDADCAQLEAAGCDLVFAPAVEEMYPAQQTFSVQPPLADTLCGASRPGHFAGVCTVVLKLFNMVQPAVAVFGKKDFQQLFILKEMVRQFNLPIRIVPGETGRADDGLALSSRNGYLTADERAEAPQLQRTLHRLASQLATQKNHRNFATLEQTATTALSTRGWRVDYVSVRSQHTLLPPRPDERDLVVLAAAYLGHTRLIDNIEISVQS